MRRLARWCPRAINDPRTTADADGKYVGADDKVNIATGYTPRTIFSGWDGYRGEFPLITLLKPSIVSDEIDSLVTLAENSGKGYLDRWEIVNSYSGCMDGDPAISVILDAYSNDIRDFNIERACKACRQTAAGSKCRSDERVENGKALPTLPADLGNRSR